MRTGELYQRYHGIYLAEVVGVDDSDKLGRIRLKSDQFEDTDDQPIWASVARPAAGDKTGVFFTPKVGDQVAIGYHLGDVREPIVLGYVHSTDRKPDTDEVGTKTHGIVTSIGSVTFSEDDNGKSIVVTFDDPKSTVTLDKDGIKLQFDKSKVTLGKDDITLDYNSSSSVKLDDDGITLDGKKVTITASDAIEIGDEKTKIKVGGKAALLHDFVDDVFAKHTHSVVINTLTATAPVSPKDYTPVIPGTDETMT